MDHKSSSILHILTMTVHEGSRKGQSKTTFGECADQRSRYDSKTTDKNRSDVCSLPGICSDRRVVSKRSVAHERPTQASWDARSYAQM